MPRGRRQRPHPGEWPQTGAGPPVDAWHARTDEKSNRGNFQRQWRGGGRGGLPPCVQRKDPLCRELRRTAQSPADQTPLSPKSVVGVENTDVVFCEIEVEVELCAANICGPPEDTEEGTSFGEALRSNNTDVAGYYSTTRPPVRQPQDPFVDGPVWALTRPALVSYEQTSWRSCCPRHHCFYPSYQTTF